jgi:hypothetical protein
MFPEAKSTFYIEYIHVDIFGKEQLSAYNLRALDLGRAINEFNKWCWAQNHKLFEIVKIEKL